MAYKNKTYVCFEADSDIQYFYLMKAWKENSNIEFTFNDAHSINSARDGSLEESIKRALNERLKNSKNFIVLIGEKTRYAYKFVRWEMERAIDLQLPIIAVNLNGKRSMDEERCPPILKSYLVMHISFNAAILQYALEKWPSSFEKFRAEGKTGPYYYQEELYQSLGL